MLREFLNDFSDHDYVSNDHKAAERVKQLICNELGWRSVSNPLSSALLLKKKIKRCTPECNACHLCVEGNHVGKNVRFSHLFQYFGSGTLGVHRKPFVGQHGVVRRLVHAHSLLLRSLARSISGHERSQGPVSRRDSQSPRVGAMVSQRGWNPGPGRFDGFVQNVTVLYLCPWENTPKAFPAMPITLWHSRTPRINWECAVCSFNHFPPCGKTVWTPFIVPRRDLTGIWCWTCILPPTTTNGC